MTLICDKCGMEHAKRDLIPFSGSVELKPGDIVPNGRCPLCGDGMVYDTEAVADLSVRDQALNGAITVSLNKSDVEEILGIKMTRAQWLRLSKQEVIQGLRDALTEDAIERLKARLKGIQIELKFIDETGGSRTKAC